MSEWSVEDTDGIANPEQGGPPGSARLLRPDGTSAAMYWRMSEAKDSAAALNASAQRDSEKAETRPLITRIRIAAGWGMRAFAEACGLLPSEWSEIETGKREATDDEVCFIASMMVNSHRSDDKSSVLNGGDRDGLVALRAIAVKQRTNWEIMARSGSSTASLKAKLDQANRAIAWADEFLESAK